MIKILFRCDGGALPEIGTGHIVRCLLVADALKDKDTQIRFVMKNYREGIEKVKQKHYQVFTIKLDEDDTVATLRAIKLFSPDVVIIDKLDNDAHLLKEIKSCDVILITFDDLGDGGKYADIRINGIVEGETDNARNSYQGSNYIIIPEYKKKPNTTVKAQCKNIFVSFGGYDHLNITLKVLFALESLPDNINVTVAIGSSYPYKKELNQFLTQSNRNFKIFYNPDNFNELLDHADIAIISGGLTLFQSLSRGIPSLIISQYDHQLKTTKKFANLNALINLGKGDTITEKEIINRVNNLLSNHELRKELRRTSLTVVDGRGLERVVQLVSIVKVKEWDTSFFGFKIAQLYPTQLSEDILQYALRKCKDENIKCLYYLCNADDLQSIKLARNYLFDHVDARITFRKDLKKYKPVKNESNVTIQSHREKDITALKKITKNMFKQSRFYSDKHFSRKLAEKLFQTWIEKSCHGYADKVFVAISNNKVVGYITCKLETTGIGSIGLVGVESHAQGMNIGTYLVYHALNWFAKKKTPAVEVPTQEINYPAQKMYKKCGFIIARRELWYHKWFE
jgi:spore coat polysaccharide biosynthesis predicted glycosyltransferase SpsG/ribosomal protein S18 acetylase RimI-like enzyme